MNEITIETWNKDGGEVWEKGQDEIYITETTNSPVITVGVNDLDKLIHILRNIQLDRDIRRDKWLERNP